MKKIIIILLGLFLFPMTGMSQNKESYLKSAYASFEKGEYDNAQKALNVYVRVYHGDASELANKIQQCKDFMNKADSAIARQQIKDAIDYYRGVLSINPNDPNIQNKINELQAIINNSHKANQANAIESKLLQIGDKVDGYSVCYLDETKTSGWVIRIDNTEGMHNQFRPYGEWRVPSVEECKVIYKSRFKLGLNKAYWTSTLSKKVANWHFYYTFDFNSGKEKSTRYHKFYPKIYIRNF